MSEETFFFFAGRHGISATMAEETVRSVEMKTDASFSKEGCETFTTVLHALHPVRYSPFQHSIDAGGQSVQFG